MASGIAVSDKCIDAYTALRKSEYSRVILKITDAADLIELESTHLRSAKEPEEDWKDFVKSLPEDSARYIISDFTVKETPTVSKAKILVLLWNPDGAPIRSKLLYAASVEALTAKVQPQKYIQATDTDDIEYSVVKNALFK
ncbi:Actin-depolymerizing factor 8 [Gracilariopsis chorda]|uniref:Actin-depolymerizing factor 8 n=1 Tax=Gracilariopsis chorda TaxID=448386 RepID=A0A2V3J6Q4_9FLOR|nr:Actin-depolymerizing factor 8 [Gracilariopsis chorda]|eukprot:PXF50079.1 Actin-depolymerizing factor 8 [Gracilariopsis chorda]